MASALSDHENNALWAGSLLAMPPPAPGTQPLAGSTMVDLLGNSLTQWATHIQDVTSGMRLPPEEVVNCPQADIVGVFNQLQGMTQVQYCHLCFEVGLKCGCSSIPRQAPSQALALWTPPKMSYVAMASSIETTASSSAAGVPPPRYLHKDCLHLNLWTRFWPPLLRTCWPLLVSVGVAGDKNSKAHPLLLASAKQGPWPHNSGHPPSEGRRQTRRLLTSSRCTCLDAPLGYE